MNFRLKSSAQSLALVGIAVLVSLMTAGGAAAQDPNPTEISITSVEVECNGSVYLLTAEVNVADADGLAETFAAVSYADQNFYTFPVALLEGQTAAVFPFIHRSGTAPTEIYVSFTDSLGNEADIIQEVAAECTTVGGSAPATATLVPSNLVCSPNGNYEGNLSLVAADDVGLQEANIAIFFEGDSGFYLADEAMSGLADTIDVSFSEPLRPIAALAVVVDTDLNAVTVSAELPLGSFPCDAAVPPTTPPTMPPTTPPTMILPATAQSFSAIGGQAISPADAFVSIDADRYASASGDFGGTSVQSAPTSASATTDVVASGGAGGPVALAITGSNSTMLMLAGLALVAAGGLITLSGRRRSEI